MALLTYIIPIVLLLTPFSCLFIFFSRKNEILKKYSSRSQVIVLYILLLSLSFFFQTNIFGGIESIGFILGVIFGIFIITLLPAFFAVILMNKFKINKVEFWNSLFIQLILVLIILIFYYF